MLESALLPFGVLLVCLDCNEQAGDVLLQLLLTVTGCCSLPQQMCQQKLTHTASLKWKQKDRLCANRATRQP